MPLEKEAQLEFILSSVKEPWSVIMIAHQYLSLILNLTISTVIIKNHYIEDRTLLKVDRISFPTRIGLLIDAGLIDKKLAKELKKINYERNNFAHKIFTEDSEKFVKERLNQDFLEKYKKNAIYCSKELYRAYEANWLKLGKI